MKQASKYFLIALGVIVVDQIVKVIVKLNMPLGDAGQIKIIGNFFKLHFIENNGAAFGLTVTKLVNGLGGNMSETTGKIILTVFSIVAVFAIGYVLFRLRDHKSPLPIFIALIFGGAMGNIIDRTFYGIFFSDINVYEGGLFLGRVVDLFYFDFWKGYLPEWVPIWGGGYTSFFPIFNIADSAITIGILVILFRQGKFFKMDEAANASAAAIVDTPKEEKKEEKVETPAPQPPQESSSPSSDSSDIDSSEVSPAT